MGRGEGKVIQATFPLHRGRSASRAHQPLEFWRDGLGRKRSNRFREVVRLLGRVALIDEPQWLAAARGDAPSAVGIAIHSLLIADTPPNRIRVDLVMTALWRVAVEDDPAAVTVYQALRERLCKLD